MHPKPSWRRILSQVGLGLALLWLSLVCLWYSVSTQILWAVGAGSLASTVYIVFMRPHAIAARPRCIIGSYLVCAACGELFRFVTEWTSIASIQLTFIELCILSLAAVIAVGLFLIISKLTHLEHPPAAGLALVAVLSEPDHGAVIAILVIATVIAFIRKLGIKKLHDLLPPYTRL